MTRLLPRFLPVWIACQACSGEDLRSRLKAAAQGDAAPDSADDGTAEPVVARPARKAGPSPAPSLEIGAADMVGAADLDGNGEDDLVLILGEVASTGSYSATLGGKPQRVARGDVDQDGDEELLIATGVGRDHPDAPIQVWALHADRAEQIHEIRTPRNQATDLQVFEGRPLLSFFVDDKVVQSSWIGPDGAEPVFSAPMAMHQRWMGSSLVVGRLYGEAPRSPGSLQVRSATGELRTLPSLRGVRALSSGDLDGDGQLELLVSDGWHYAYGEHGDARLVLFRGPSWSEPMTLAWLEKDYSIRGIEVLSLGSEPAILLTGSHGVYILTPDELGWSLERVGKVSETGNAVLRNTEAGPTVVISGDPAVQIPLPVAAR